jgi:hypothetical protein
MIIRDYLHIIGYISALFVICCIIYFIVRHCCKTNTNTTRNNRIYIQQQPQSVYNPMPPPYQHINNVQPSAPSFINN